jgi:CHAT domain-containing protein/tetratricopeptide (TPR) repeat protein
MLTGDRRGGKRALLMKACFAILVFLFLVSTAYAQTLANLEAEQKKLEEEMSALNRVEKKDAAYASRMLEIIKRLDEIEKEILVSKNNGSGKDGLEKSAGAESIAAKPVAAPKPTKVRPHFTLMDASKDLENGEIERGINRLVILWLADPSEANVIPLNLAVCASIDQLGDYRQAVGFANEGLAVIDQAIDRGASKGLRGVDISIASSKVILLSNKIRALTAWGKISDAEEVLQKLEEFLKIAVPGEVNEQNYSFFSTLAGTYIAMSEIALRKGLSSLAAKTGAKALEIAKDAVERAGKLEIMKTNPYYLGFPLFQLARAYMLSGNGKEAEETFRRQIGLLEKSPFGNSVPVHSYFMFADVLKANGKLDEAAANYRKGEEMCKAPAVLQMYRSLSWLGVLGRAEILKLQGKTGEAIETYREAIKVIKEFYAKIRSGTAKLSYIDYSSRAYRELAELLIAEGRLAEAFTVIEESKSKTLLDILTNVPIEKRSLWPPDVREKEKEIRKNLDKLDNEIRSTLKSRSLEPGSIGAPAEGKAAKGNIEAELDERLKFDEFLLSSKPHLVGTKGLSVDSIECGSFEVLCSRLKEEKKSLVEYFAGTDSIYVLTISDGKLDVNKSPVPKDEIFKLVRKLNREIRSKSDEWKTTADKLAESLVRPASAALAGSESLYIVPTGELFYLPFEILPLSDGSLLFNNKTITYLTQAGLLLLPVKESGTSAPGTNNTVGNSLEGFPVTIFANADSTLPGAEIEANGVRDMLGGKNVTVYLKDEATKSRFLGGSFGNGVLHVATHGVLDRLAPLQSGLVFSASADGGFLTMLEIFKELDLAGVRLVVLSACNSAVGEVSAGDDVMSLSSAFTYAGAPFVIASLWEVDDEATASFMKEFYKAYIESGDASKSLALAKKAISGIEKWKSPYFWAAFVLIGIH